MGSVIYPHGKYVSAFYYLIIFILRIRTLSKRLVLSWNLTSPFLRQPDPYRKSAFETYQSKLELRMSPELEADRAVGIHANSWPDLPACPLSYGVPLRSFLNDSFPARVVDVNTFYGRHSLTYQLAFALNSMYHSQKQRNCWSGP